MHLLFLDIFYAYYQADIQLDRNYCIYFKVNTSINLLHNLFYIDYFTSHTKNHRHIIRKFTNYYIIGNINYNLGFKK